MSLYSVKRVLVKLKVKNRNWCLKRDMDHLVNSASELRQGGMSELTLVYVPLTTWSYGDGTSVKSLIRNTGEAEYRSCDLCIDNPAYPSTLKPPLLP